MNRKKALYSKILYVLINVFSRDCGSFALPNQVCSVGRLSQRRAGRAGAAF